MPVNQHFRDPVRKHVLKQKRGSLGEKFGFPLMRFVHTSSFLSAQAAHGSFLLILKAEDVLPLTLRVRGWESVIELSILRLRQP